MENYIKNVWDGKVAIDYHTNRGNVVIRSLYPTTIKGQQVVEITIANGQNGYLALKDRPDVLPMLEAEQERRQKTLLDNVPGIDEYLTAVNAASDYLDDLERMMEDGDNDGANPPQKPAISVKDAAKKYPVAVAYCEIINAAASNPASQVGFERRQAGNRAIKSIIDGADIIEAAAKMKAEIDNIKPAWD